MPRPALLEEVLEAAGGERAWRSVQRVSARVRTGGLLPRTRVPGSAFADYRVTVETARQRTVLDPFPRTGERAVFDAGTVSIESTAGEVLRRRERAREPFFGLAGIRRQLRWDALDATYFAGYAMWNYLTNPLLLLGEGVEVRVGPEWSGEGERWRSLEVVFPAELHTHSARQRFWIDGSGRLVRHDYTAEVVAGWADAAHYCRGHADCEGLLIPTERQVLPRRRDLRSRRHPTLVSLALSEITIEWGATE